MKLAKFASLEAAQNQLAIFNDLARHPTSSSTFSLTSINLSIDESFYWFDFTACVENGGLGRDQIATMENDLDIHKFVNIEEVVASGWLPETII